MWLFWLVEWKQQNLGSKFVKMKKCDSFFKINLWNNNSEFIQLLTIHSYLPTLLCIYTYVYIECASTSIYI
jgi:hypothetical protein